MEVIVFETKHLVIRQSTMNDVEGYPSFYNDDDVMKFIGDGTWGGGEEVVKKDLFKNIAFYESHPGLGFWSVEDRLTKKVVGEAGLGLLSETGEIEAGFILSQTFWGRGLGTELFQGLLQYGFSKLKLNRIVAVTHSNNLASIRIMEKCGMTFVGRVFNDGVWVSKYEARKTTT